MEAGMGTAGGEQQRTEICILMIHRPKQEGPQEWHQEAKVRRSRQPITYVPLYTRRRRMEWHIGREGQNMRDKHADMLLLLLYRTTKYPSLKGVDPKFRRNAKVR